MSLPEVAIKKIMEIVPYVPGKSKVSGSHKVIKLSANENPFGASPKAIEAIKSAAKNSHLYPDGGCHKLRESIGRMHNINPDMIVCGAGSDELIALLCQSYAGEGNEVLYSQYGFLMYPISALRSGAIPVAAKEKNYRTDIDSILSAVTEKTRIVFIANPNNPTGSYLKKDEMRKLRSELPENVLLVIDAAYSEYVTAPDYDSGIDLVSSTNNTVMLRTFSKIYGLAALRLGWAYAPEHVVDVLNRVRGPFNVSSIAQAAGVAAIEDNSFTNRSIDHNNKWLKIMFSELSDIGLKALPTVANFILIEFPKKPGNTAPEVDAKLKEEGIIVRRMDAYGLPNFLRVTIGLEEGNESFLRSMREFFKW